jgi:type IV secretion system protein VirB4
LNLHVRDLGHTLMFSPTGPASQPNSVTLPHSFGVTRACPSSPTGHVDVPLAASITSRNQRCHFHYAADDDRLAFAVQYLETKGAAERGMDDIAGLNGLDTQPRQRNRNRHCGAQHAREQRQNALGTLADDSR